MTGEPGPRVLLGNLGPISRAPSEQGCRVVGQEDRPSAIASRLVSAPVLERLRSELTSQQHVHQ